MLKISNVPEGDLSSSGFLADENQSQVPQSEPGNDCRPQSQ